VADWTLIYRGLGFILKPKT